MKKSASEILDLLPDTKKVVVILSGGLDSSIAMFLLSKRYGAENISALTFFYGQKQELEIEKAKQSTKFLGIKHKILDLSILGEISQGFSANVDSSIKMPTIKEVIGDPAPKTMVPNRNMIFMSLAAAYAEVQGANYIIMGLQENDMYNYHDTTPTFISKVNDVLAENRKHKIKIIAPFSSLTKTDELNVLFELLDEEKANDFLKMTLTCYNPTVCGLSCGQCPSCAERLKAFSNIGRKDPVKYVLDSR